MKCDFDAFIQKYRLFIKNVGFFVFYEYKEVEEVEEAANQQNAYEVLLNKFLYKRNYRYKQA